MDKFIDDRFIRLERALASLIESLTKHSPTLAQARDLDAADAELARGLADVQRHQANHGRICELRIAAGALDARVRDTLAGLAATRRKVMAAGATGTGGEETRASRGRLNPVQYDELLGYARRISKTTMPPAGIMAAMLDAYAQEEAQAQGQEGQGGAEGVAGPPPAGAAAAAPAATSPASAQSPLPGAAALAPSRAQPPPQTQTQQLLPQQQQQQKEQAASPIALPDGLAQHLNPLAGAIFLPWPGEERIRAGALATIQAIVERGINPSQDEARRRREEEERQVREEREALDRREREARAREELDRIRKERDGVAAEAEKKFRFVNFDDDDDDDDDDESEEDEDDQGKDRAMRKKEREEEKLKVAEGGEMEEEKGDEVENGDEIENGDEMEGVERTDWAEMGGLANQGSDGMAGEQEEMREADG